MNDRCHHTPTPGPQSPCTKPQGFTLVEVMVALLVGGLLMAAVMTSFRGQHATYLHQDQAAEMQQNLRVAMDMLSRDVRSAGFSATVEQQQEVGIADNNDSTSTLVFSRVDENGDVECLMYDQYESASTNSPALGRAQSNTAWTGNSCDHGALHFAKRPLAENIEDVEFLYLMADGSELLNPGPGQLDDIRGLKVSMLARAANQDTGYTHTKEYTTASGTTWGSYDDGYRRRMQTQTIKFRNLGLE